MHDARVAADRLRGGLYGLLVGDALGVPYEFHPPGELPAAAELEMDPPADFARAHRGTPPGTFSDDGAQALALLASLLDRGRLDVDDFGARLVGWYERGDYAVDGRVFDCGIQTRRAIERMKAGAPAASAGGAGECDNGNGSLMRVLPLALFHDGDDAALVRDAMAQSGPTHAHPRSRVACALYCLWARRELAGDPLAYESAAAALPALLDGALAEELARHVLADGPPRGRGSGYVVDCLHSARFACAAASSYEGVVKAAIALGDDTDTTACVAGGIAGIRFGEVDIPERFRAALRGREIVDPLADRLVARRAG